MPLLSIGLDHEIMCILGHYFAKTITLTRCFDTYFFIAELKCIYKASLMIGLIARCCLTEAELIENRTRTLEL